MLAASGELNREIGGIPVRPEINADVALQPRQVMGTFAAAWAPSPRAADLNRRSLYALQLRGLRDPFMETFNQPGPDNPCEARDASTVTPQVFALFNARASHDRALAFAARLTREERLASSGQGDVDRERVLDQAFQLAFGRHASPEEVAASLRHWEESAATHASAVPPPEAPVTTVRREAVEENTGETFTFTERLDAAADYVAGLRPSDVDADTRALADVCLVLLNANKFVYLD